MDIDVTGECRRLLLHMVQQYDPHNAEGIIGYIEANIPLEHIRRCLSSTSNQLIHILFDHARAMLQSQPPQWPPSSGQGLGLQFPQSQPQFHPINSYQIFQPAPILPHWQLQFGPSGGFGNRAPFPGSSGSFGANQTPCGSPHPGPQFYPNSTFGGHQASFRPTGPSGGFQSSLPGSSGSRGHPRPQNIPGDGMQSNFRKARQSDTGYPPSSSNAQKRPCIDHFNKSGCKTGGDSGYSHEYDMKKKRPIHSLETLPKLDSMIKDLCQQNSSTPIPIERLPQVFYDKHGEPLLVGGFQPESLRSLLTRLKTIKVIERDGQHYVALVANTCGVGKVADDSELALAPPSYCCSKIFIYLYPDHRFSIEDIENYFSKYGPVHDVRIPSGKTYGFVTFVYPETVKLVLSENGQRIHHYIHGDPLKVFPYKEKHELHELQELAQRDAHFNSRTHMTSDVDVTREHQRSRNTEESLNDKSADEATDEWGLPDSLGI